MSARTFRRWRPVVQAGAMALFLYLVLRAGRTGFPSADLFFRLDPLAVFGHALAARQIILPLLGGAALVVIFTVLLGRVWCGWLCPLGTVLDGIPARRKSQKDGDPSPRLRQVKYFLLALVVVAALMGNLSFLVLDPITIAYRTVAVVAWPAFNALLSAGERLLYNIPFLRAPVDAFEGAMRGTLLPPEQPVYGAALGVALFFGGLLALNAVRPRFWCRYLCPLGALLGLAGKVSWLRRTAGATCIECGRCAKACPTGTIDAARGYASDPSECIMCLDCAPACAGNRQAFTGHRRPAAWQAYDPSRRQFVASTAVAVAAAGLFAIDPAGRRPHPRLIRPPGAADPAFTAQCIRCGICIKTCPTSGLQPGVAETPWGGVWTPVLVPRLGHCDYSCNACGQACPTGAIPPLALEDKRNAVIGQAYIDRDRCLPWADNVTCLVCEEMCPLPEKAIQLEDVTVTGWDGEAIAVRRPHVLHDLCVGCGICENRCPLAGEAAIRVQTPTAL